MRKETNKKRRVSTRIYFFIFIKNIQKVAASRQQPPLSQSTKTGFRELITIRTSRTRTKKEKEEGKKPVVFSRSWLTQAATKQEQQQEQQQLHKQTTKTSTFIRERAS